MKNWKGFGRKGSWPTRSTVLAFPRKGWGKRRKVWGYPTTPSRYKPGTFLTQVRSVTAIAGTPHRSVLIWYKVGQADPRRRSAATRLLGSWVRIPQGAWMFVSCTVFVLSGRGLCNGPILRLEESCRLWCVFECDQVKMKNLLHLLWTSR
jgi:hypothetical protein